MERQRSSSYKQKENYDETDLKHSKFHLKGKTNVSNLLKKKKTENQKLKLVFRRINK